MPDSDALPTPTLDELRLMHLATLVENAQELMVRCEALHVRSVNGEDEAGAFNDIGESLYDVRESFGNAREAWNLWCAEGGDA